MKTNYKSGRRDKGQDRLRSGGRLLKGDLLRWGGNVQAVFIMGTVSVAVADDKERIAVLVSA